MKYLIPSFLLFTALLCAGCKPKPAQDCVSFDCTNVSVKLSYHGWMVEDDGRQLLFFDGDEEDDARKAVQIIRHYGMNSHCFVGRPDPGMIYFLVDGEAPQGPFEGERCRHFNLDNIEVKKINGRWKVVDGDVWLLDFEDKEAEARKAYQIIKYYGFEYQCSVGYPGPKMEYWRK